MTIHCPAFDLPDSELLSEGSATILGAHRQRMKALMVQATQPNPDTPSDPREAERQQCYESEPYQQLIQDYPVNIDIEDRAGVPVETFTPKKGIAPDNKKRLLINIHGGGFMGGSRTLSRLESIPVAVLGNIKVISVDYRMAPEHRHPAARDDAFAVYQACLKDYTPEQIGVFGSSAGAYTSAQLMVHLQEQGVALPAAVAMIAGGAFRKVGDSMVYGSALVKAVTGYDLNSSKDAYFEGSDRNSPAVTPGLSDTLMAGFPPAFLAASTRDYLLSSVIATHRKLINLDVPAELHLWDGLDHVFHCNMPKLTESEELHQRTVAFFNRHLAASSAP